MDDNSWWEKGRKASTRKRTKATEERKTRSWNGRRDLPFGSDRRSELSERSDERKHEVRTGTVLVSGLLRSILLELNSHKSQELVEAMKALDWDRKGRRKAWSDNTRASRRRPSSPAAAAEASIQKSVNPADRLAANLRRDGRRRGEDWKEKLGGWWVEGSPEPGSAGLFHSAALARTPFTDALEFP